MDKKKYINPQSKINEIWKKQWQSYLEINPRAIFLQRLFVEGYPVLKKYIPPDTKEVLDIGGGTGRYGIQIALDFPKCHVTESDILEESMRVARILAEKMGAKNIDFKIDDILSSSFPDNKFDVVFCDVIQSLPEYRRVLREMKRITRPGGRVITIPVNTWNFHTLYRKLMGKRYEYGYEKSFTRKEMSKIMDAEGLNVVATDAFYVGYGLFRLKKYNRFFHLLGKIVNRLAKMLDKFTDRFFTKNFGFQIVVVGKKHNVN